MIILKLLLFLLIFLLLLIIWAIIFPRSFWLEYDKFDGFTAKVKFAFVKFKI